NGESNGLLRELLNLDLGRPRFTRWFRRRINSACASKCGFILETPPEIPQNRREETQLSSFVPRTFWKSALCFQRDQKRRVAKKRLKQFCKYCMPYDNRLVSRFLLWHS